MLRKKFKEWYETGHNLSKHSPTYNGFTVTTCWNLPLDVQPRASSMQTQSGNTLAKFIKNLCVYITYYSIYCQMEFQVPTSS